MGSLLGELSIDCGKMRLKIGSTSVRCTRRKYDARICTRRGADVARRVLDHGKFRGRHSDVQVRWLAYSATHPPVTCSDGRTIPS
jgi:hypothetical protein